MVKLVAGMKVRYLIQPEWGVGHLVALHENGSKAEVQFPAREGGAVLVSTKGSSLVPHQLSVGDLVRTHSGRDASVISEQPGGRGLRRYGIRYSDGEEDEMPESELRAQPPKPDLLTMLREGRVADSRNFLLRRAALRLDDERRCDALGALLASRVMVKPHQVGVVQRVLSSRRPRFVLADEVGLGKTIEAGMIFSALRLAGLAKRVLVITPSHLTVQWLGELFHKFNQLFTLMDSERFSLAVKEQPDRSPWQRFDKVVTSLEQLSRSDEHREAAAAPEAHWDLVIIDEAHHLKSPRAFEVARSIARNCWGLLLLTATPMQLDPAEYHGLLTLIDPDTAPTLEQFQQRLERQEQLSETIRSLLPEAKPNAAAVKKSLAALAKRFPEDALLGDTKTAEQAVAHLAETYSLSERLIRNRRAIVGGFSERRLSRHLVRLAPVERTARDAALEMLRGKGNLRGAALSNLLRRLESSSSAFTLAVKGTQSLAQFADELKLPSRDAKFEAFSGVLKEIWRSEPKAKVLVFTEARDTLEMLQVELRKENVEALAYHGDLPLLDRDRQVARFRDPEGPKVLVCTEVGGEGRNFQFSHHLVNYDLPWSPAAMEQRIGRLDRIGQAQPVDIHVLDVQGTFSADVLSLLADAVGVFGQTVGGLDAVLEEVEGRLTELALVSAEERTVYAEALKARVAEARASVQRAYDPLLDRRSFDADAVGVLLQRAATRMEIDEDEADDSLEDRLWAVARDLDERLEESVTELARKVGIGVDTDEQVDAFQCAFHFGHALNVEALPGLELGTEKTVLGTFWRDTAVEIEEIDFFATGHSIVEALFGFLRDGPYGRNGMRYIEKRGATRARGMEFLFHVVTPEPEDTAPGSRVPSRQLARFFGRQLIAVAISESADGQPVADPSLLPLLETEGRSLKGDEVLSAFPSLAEFVPKAAVFASVAAEKELSVRAARARKAIEKERDDVLRRMRLSLAHQGLPPGARDRLLDAEAKHYDALLATLAQLSVALDSACGFAVNR